MAQTTFSIRMDENLKKQFDALCSEFGMNMSTAFTIFAKTVVRKREIPFKISAEPINVTESWSPEFWEIVKKNLAASEYEYKNGDFKDAFEVMEAARVKYGL